MAFLFSPKVRSLSDESLESYLLRVVAENFFNSYQELSLAIRDELHELDFDAHGAFPTELKRLNVYRAKHNSHFRMRALGLLESLLDLPIYELQKLALFRSNRTFVGSTTAVHRGGVDIPLSFIRNSGEDCVESIPICPECLKESPYIRQVWHIKFVEACSLHECKLIHCCPECQEPVNYIENESITHCSCGFELATALSSKADSQAVLLSRGLFGSEQASNNPIFSSSTTVSQRFAALLWWQKRYAKPPKSIASEAVGYFDDWPANFYSELDKVTDGAEPKLIDVFNRTPFKSIYGNLILDAQCLWPEEKESHFIHVAVMDYLYKLVAANPKSKKSNIADTLVSVAETAVLLSTTHEQVYRLYQDGILVVAFPQKLHQRIESYIGVFHLRQVIEYKSSFGIHNQGVYLSAW